MHEKNNELQKTQNKIKGKRELAGLGTKIIRDTLIWHQLKLAKLKASYIYKLMKIQIRKEDLRRSSQNT